MADELLYSEKDGHLFVKASGRVTSALCLGLRERILRRLAQGEAAAGISVDLSGCEFMDSTFIGLLVGLTKLADTTIFSVLKDLLEKKLSAGNPQE